MIFDIFSIIFPYCFNTIKKKGGNIIEIKIIGSNCSNGIKLKKELKRAIEKSDSNVDILELNEDQFKKRYHIRNIPALLIDNQIVSEGKILNERELTKMIALYSAS
ncbi:MAG: thioredoxin family protein [Bacilli bacterium]|nr:thioredoxin family protein [Bacilli bacterium]